MHNSKLKNTLTLVLLIFFISTGILSYSYLSGNCDFVSCCESDCCGESENSCIPVETPSSLQDICCDISEGPQNNFEYSKMYVSHSKINASIIFYPTNHPTFKESNRRLSVVSTARPSITHNFIPALRI